MPGSRSGSTGSGGSVVPTAARRRSTTLRAAAATVEVSLRAATVFKSCGAVAVAEAPRLEHMQQ